ncbi:MAG: hypothetical protein V4587_00250 [Acidobacteriota bacterium]
MTKKEEALRAWERLRPGYTRIWLSSQDIEFLGKLRESGIVGEFPPEVMLASHAIRDLKRYAQVMGVTPADKDREAAFQDVRTPGKGVS